MNDFQPLQHIVPQGAQPVAPVPTMPTPPPTPSPVEGPKQSYSLKTDDIKKWRADGNGQNDDAIFHMAYNVDPKFKESVDRMKDYNASQPKTWNDGFNTWALNQMYTPKDIPKPDKLTGIMLKHVQETAQPPVKKAGLPEYLSNMAGGIGNDVNQAASGLNEALTAAHDGITDYRGTALQGTESANTNPAQSVLAVGGELAGGAANALSEPAKPVINSAMQLIQVIGQNHPEVLNNPIVKPLIGALQSGIQGYQTWAQQHQASAAAVGGAAKMASLPLAMQGAESTINSVGKGMEGLGTAVAKPVKSMLSSQANDVTNLVQPKVTDKLIKDTLQKNPELVKEGGLLKSGKVLPSEGEKKLAETAKTIPGFGKTKDVAKNAKAVSTALEDESNSLLEKLKTNDSVDTGFVPHANAHNIVDTAVKKAAEDFGEQEGVFNSTAKMWKETSKQFPETDAGQWEARIAFDKKLTERFGTNIFEKGSARAVAIRTVRNAVNDVIDQASNGVYRPQINRLSHMYDILENLATKGGKNTVASGLTKLAKNKYVRTAAGVLGTGEVLKHTHLLP